MFQTTNGDGSILTGGAYLEGSVVLMAEGGCLQTWTGSGSEMAARVRNFAGDRAATCLKSIQGKTCQETVPQQLGED